MDFVWPTPVGDKKAEVILFYKNKSGNKVLSKTISFSTQSCYSLPQDLIQPCLEQMKIKSAKFIDDPFKATFWNFHLFNSENGVDVDSNIEKVREKYI